MNYKFIAIQKEITNFMIISKKKQKSKVNQLLLPNKIKKQQILIWIIKTKFSFKQFKIIIF